MTNWLNTDFHREPADGNTLSQAVHLTVGAGSTCWASLEHAGEFESTRAHELSDELVDYIERHYEKREKPDCTLCVAGTDHPTLFEDDEPEVLKDCG